MPEMNRTRVAYSLTPVIDVMRTSIETTDSHLVNLVDTVADAIADGVITIQEQQTIVIDAAKAFASNSDALTLASLLDERAIPVATSVAARMESKARRKANAR